MLGDTIGEWKSGSHLISLYRSASSQLLARLQDQAGTQIDIDSDHIKCGILRVIPHNLFIQKINQLAQENIKETIAVCCYPSEGQTTEVWVFEAKKGAALWIKKAKENLKQRDSEKEEKAIDCYQKALKLFEEALKIQEKQKGNTEELRSAISQLKKELFLQRIKRDLPLYLSSEEEREAFNEVIELYKEEDLFSGLSEYLKACEESTLTPCQLFLSALLDEHFNHPSAAIQNYLRLAEHNPDSIPCYKKAEELINQINISDPFALPHFLEKLDGNKLSQLRQTTHFPEDLNRFLLQKDAVRMTFEKCLATLNQHSPQTKVPTCFICFNVEEADVGKWLEQVLVPDLDRMGIQPLFCFRDLNPGKADLSNFQSLIRDADQVMIACTPDLKRKCKELKKSPTGVAQEIRLARERYKDSDKYETNFLLYLKGDQKNSCPDAFFEPILGTALNYLEKSKETSILSYYENAFEFFGGMRNIPRTISRQVKEDFLLQVNKICVAGKINLAELEKWRHEKQFQIERVLKEAQERVIKMTKMVHLPLPPKDFTGRQQELQDLHAACQQHHRVAITGLGGVGKTALALKYANDHQADYQFVYLIPAGTSQLIKDGLLQLADDLHLPKTEKIEERLQLLKRKLDQFDQKYLLIFDGIDQLEAFDELSKYIPQRGNCLLLTSRMGEQKRVDNYEAIKLDVFSLEDAVNYLLRATSSADKDRASVLAERLGRLPLALTHAAGYIRSRNISIDEYIQQFDRYQLKLFESERLNLSKEEKTILTTWNISLDAIKIVHGCSLAKEVMAFLAFLGQAPISLDLVKEWFKTAHSSNEDLEVMDALRYLCDYSMIDRTSLNFYQVHLLVQQVNQHQTANPQKVFEQAFMTLNLQINKFQKDNVNTWNLTKPMVPHALSLLKRQDLMRNIVLENQYEFLIRLGMICQNYGFFSQALEIQENCLKTAKQWNEQYPLLQKTSDAVAESYNNIGTVFQSIGKHEEALRCQQEASKIWKVHQENPNVAASYNNIGWSLQNLGRHEEALEYNRKALEILLKIYGGEEYPDVALSYNGIGLSMRGLGKYDEALKSMRKALGIRLKIYKEQHTEIAFSYNDIGSCLEGLGKYDEALEYHQKAIDIFLKINGERHFNVANSYSNVGTNLCSQGRYLESLENHRKAFEIWQEIYGENHPSVATSYNNIGASLDGLGKYEEALDSKQKALEIRQKVNGKDHPDIATSYNNIGVSLYRLGKNDKALEYNQKALEIRQKIHGENHPDVALSHYNIGSNFFNLERYNMALDSHRKALQIWLKVFKEDHPYLARSYSSIGSTLQNLEKHKEAVENHRKALKILLKFYGETNLDVAFSYKSIAFNLHLLGEYDEASQCYQKAVTIFEKFYPPKHAELSITINLLNAALNMKQSQQQTKSHSILEKILSRYKVSTKEKALRRAAFSGNIEDIKYLVESEKVDIDSKDQKKGRTALHWAVIQKNKLAILCLLQLGANRNILDATGKKPANYDQDNLMTMQQLNTDSNASTANQEQIKNQSKLKEILARYSVSTKEQALRRAAFSGNIEDINYLIATEQVDINSKDPKQGLTALHWAVKQKNKIAIQWLLQLGADKDIVDAKGKKPKDYDQDGLMN